MYKRFIFIIILISCFLIAETKPLAIRPFLDNPSQYNYNRGTFLIILGNENGLDELQYSNGLKFLKYKKSQGFTVDVIIVDTIPIIDNENNTVLSGGDIQSYIQDYYDSDPMLEYILLVGDIDGSLTIPPSDQVQSYNEDTDTDVTDYKYTYFSEDEVLNPHFFVGRWSAGVNDHINFYTARTITYGLLDSIGNNCNPNYVHNFPVNSDYVNNALLVGGGYNGNDEEPYTWPVTPVWTSMWLKNKLSNNNYNEIHEVYFNVDNQIEGTTEIKNFWNEGVGIINYRGWGDVNGWKKPLFFDTHINLLSSGWELPVVMSFVCNTGDFENNSFGEQLIKGGTPLGPKGAVAVIAPSDLDTDTRFNNVMCGQVWDEILEGRIFELGPALHAGKQALIKEFGEDFEVTGEGGTVKLAEFYHHVYGILGDPSISVWTGTPKDFQHTIPDIISIPDTESIIVRDEYGNPMQDVVAALLDGDELIAKGISNQDGKVHLEFISTYNPPNSNYESNEGDLYLNHAQYLQVKKTITYNSAISDELENNYLYTSPTEFQYNYQFQTSHENPSLYNWMEINEIGDNLCLSDDSVTRIAIPFPFIYFGNTYHNITVSSNGWVSFEEENIPYFWNFSIPFPMGPSAMVAPFMDDLDDNDEEPFIDLDGDCILDPNEEYEDRDEDGEWDEGQDLNVYSYFDSDRFIVEWDNIANGENDNLCPNLCTYETFQLILTDEHEIIFQYKDIEDVDANGNYSTIGIESPDQNYGVMYQFRNELFDGTTIIQNEMAIKFTGPSSMGASHSSNLPNDINLHKAYPNPFNPSVTIRFDVHLMENVDVNIYDLYGRNVITLVSEIFTPGTYEIDWDGVNINGERLASGVYIVAIKTAGKILTQKIVLLK